MKITLIVSSLEWLTCLFLFIIVEFEKLLSTHFFLLRKSSKRVQCSNGSVAPSHEILFHSMVGDKVA